MKLKMDHQELTADQIERIADAVIETNPSSSIEARLQKNQHLAWACDPTDKKVYLRWVDKTTGAPVDSSSVVHITMPPGPIAAAYIDGQAITKFDTPAEQVFQKVIFKSDDASGKFTRFYKALSYVRGVLNEDRQRFLASNTDHEMLSDAHRKLIGKPQLEQSLIDILDDENNNSHWRATDPKRKIFTSNKIGGNILRKEDEETLDKLDSTGMLTSYLTSKGGEQKVNLLNITRPDGLPLTVEDYGTFHARDAIACLSFDIYRLHCRMKKGKPDQHSVVWSATGLQLVTNGVPANGESKSLNVLDILSAKPKPSDSSLLDDAKEARTKRKQQQLTKTIKKIKSSPIVYDDE